MGDTMRPFHAAVLVLAGSALALVAGCGSDPEPPAQYGGWGRQAAVNPYANYGYGYGYVQAAPQPATSISPLGDSSTGASVHIDDRIVRACGDLPTAHFAFDSANVLPDSSYALDALARCFVSGPLKGRSLKLIGHADPRGETEYNLALGHQRAYSVVDILAQRGVELGRMATSSKGEFEASGADESGWARDRKVDVLLAE
jgi:peptidoglycan-associated lipoprotein